jgi:hypothetical protein
MERFPQMPGRQEVVVVVPVRPRPTPKVPGPSRGSQVSQAVPADVEMGDVSEAEEVEQLTVRDKGKGKEVDRGSQGSQVAGSKRDFQESPTRPSAPPKRQKAGGEGSSRKGDLSKLSFVEDEAVDPAIIPMVEGQVRGHRLGCRQESNGS